jgi:hypothetical protein
MDGDNGPDNLGMFLEINRMAGYYSWVFSTLHVLRNLLMCPISYCYITLGWTLLPKTTTLAYWSHFLATEKMKCC